ncbi:MAG: TIGR02466 family protein [Pseudomonadota bacterium]
MNRLDTFATPIWMRDLLELEPLRLAWVELVRERRRQTPTAERRSNRVGWQSNADLLDGPELAPLRQALLVAVKEALGDHGVKPGSLVLNLSGWANVHERGGHNVPHVHEGCILSGTVYLHAPPGSGALYFADPRPAALMEGFARVQPVSSSASRGYTKFVVEPRNLLLVMFPSWLSHGVETCECDERISIAFNVHPALARP